jgi:benzoate transport
MNNATDPRQILDQSEMTRAMIIVVIITVFLNAMDGFDVLAISFAAPGIAAEWGISNAALGFVLSAELVGMAIGSIFLGGVGDKYGRRPTVLGCLVVMSLGMFMATTAGSPIVLCIWRVLTGLGIGGMLSVTNATVAEFSNKRWRSLCISFMVIGYPLGGVFGGDIAQRWLLVNFDWRSVFYFGAIVCGAMIPFVYFLVPESVHWLTRKQPENALDRINLSMSKLGKPTVAALPEINAEEQKKSVGDIFSKTLIVTTLLVTAAYFLHITTFYFILKWTPKIVADMGFAAAAAGGVLKWANIGGALGGMTFGILTARFGLKPLTIAILVLTFVGVTVFGRTPADLDRMALLAAIAGFFGNAGVSGLYSIVAYAFPTHVRATGTGFVIGVGRAGAVLAPILAGFLFDAQKGLPTVALVLAAGSLLAAIVLIFLKLDSDGPIKATVAQTEPQGEGLAVPAS